MSNATSLAATFLTAMPDTPIPANSVECKTDPVECDIVAFMAHPDDAELQCGGTLALAVERGWRAGVVDFTRGEMATRGTPEQRDVESLAAAHELGLSCRVNLQLPDGHLHDGDEPRRAVVRLLRSMRPKVVIAPPREDHHADHVAVATILERAFYLSGIAKYLDEGDGGEAWRPNALLHTVGSRAAVPDLVVDISSVHEKRRCAIGCHQSQFFNEDSDEPSTRISHPEFHDWIDGGLRRFGFLVGARYGEAFTSSMPLAVLDPVQQFEKVPWKQPKADT